MEIIYCIAAGIIMTILIISIVYIGDMPTIQNNKK